MGFDAAAIDLRVTGTRVDELRFPMDPPLELAGRLVTSRRYVVLALTLEDGTTGKAYVLTRGQPIGAAAELLAQQVLGRSVAALFCDQPRDRGKSPSQRALALLDICAWDLAGQLQQVPVRQLLGGFRDSQPALLVAGYRRHGEDDRAMARRLVTWREEGYRAVKIAADLGDDRTTRLLAELRRLVPAEDLGVVLDLGFAGHDVPQIAAAIDTWRPHGVTWVEDPVPPGAAADTAAVREQAAIPVAAGDEATPAELDGLLSHDAVDVLRADTTTVGGLTGLSDVMARAHVPLSLHVYPEIHRHAAMAMDSESPVETFAPGDDFDFVDRFMRYADPAVVDGRFPSPVAPGLGLLYRPENCSANVVRSTSFAPD